MLGFLCTVFYHVYSDFKLVLNKCILCGYVLEILLIDEILLKRKLLIEIL